MSDSNQLSTGRDAISEARGDRPAVKSVSRAADILLCLSNGINTISSVADCCKLSKSTVHRLLKAMEESLIVSQDPLNRHYYPGPLLTRFSSRPQSTHEYLVINTVGEMQGLADIGGEMVTLGIMTGIQYVQLHEIPSRHDLRVIEDGQIIRPLYMGATTKVLLSQLDDERLQIVMKNLFIEKRTAMTVTDKEDLMVRIRNIRRQGYDISRSEAVAGALCLSAAIGGYVTPAALSIIGPETRLEPAISGLIEQLTQSAGRISRNITAIFQAQDGAAVTRLTGADA